MWAYALIAIGFINWDYQRSAPHAMVHSLLIIIPGAILLAFTFNKALSALLQKPASKYIWGLIGAAALAYAFLN